VEDTRIIFSPWIDGKIPETYRWQMEDNKLKFKMFESISMEDIVKAGGACIGSPETCVNVLNYLTDAGVDEALLLMQMYTTPHDKIMRSIELLAKEVKPRLKSRTNSTDETAATTTVSR
jgi:hypothetical protein